MAFLEWLNGKKTVIGAICLYIAELLTLHVAPSAPDAGWIVPVAGFFKWLGDILIPVGLLHKASKASEPAK